MSFIPFLRSVQRFLLSVLLRPKILSVCLLASVLVGCATGGNFSGASASGKATSSPVVLSYGTDHVQVGQTVAFSAQQNGMNVSGGVWQVLGGSVNGVISKDGVYTAPSVPPTPNSASVTFSYDSTTVSAVLTVLNPQAELLSATPAAVMSGNTQVTFDGGPFVNGAVIYVNNSVTTTTYINQSTISAIIDVSSGATGSLTITAANPVSVASVGTPFILPISTPSITVTPALLHGGPTTFTVTGKSFVPGSVILMDGKELPTTVSSATTLTANGYIPPWQTGSSTIGVALSAGSTPVAQLAVPIATTAVTYDVASRFATQAAFGPRHDIIEHIQQTGLDQFITEQMQQPPIVYDAYAPCCGPRKTFLDNATSGQSLLRARVSMALQSFIAQQGIFLQSTLIPWQHMMEADAFGNFEQLLTDVSSNPAMGLFLDVVGNAAPSNPSLHPNQNYARELMQLFSLGDVMLNDDGSVQTDGAGAAIPTYDQATILDLSRVFTGWNCDLTPDPVLNPYGCNYAFPIIATDSQHDHGPKTLFGKVTLPAGQDAATDRRQAVHTIFNHPNVPPFVSHILIQRLVKSNPSPAYISRIAKVFEDDGTGTRGNLAVVIRAILLDPEARAGDVADLPEDGFLQEPLLFETFGMNILGIVQSDGEPIYVPGLLGQDYDYPATVFGFYSPTNTIPGTKVVSPEFGLLNDLSMIQRSQLWWGMIQGSVEGFSRQPNYLYSTFTTVPEMVDALNHLLYHGRMSNSERTTILNYCSGLDPKDLQAQLDAAIFLAGNSDSYNVSH